jgi:CHAD domain-containing protein
MTYSFDTPCGVEDGFRAIADSQIGKALGELDREDDDREEIVHDVRLRCKKLRGLIRLVRPAFPDYKPENAALRAIAHLFEDMRDAKVMQETYDLIIAAHEEQVERSAFSGVRREMTSRRKAVLARADWEALQGEARERLLELRGRARNWKLEAESWEALGDGLAKTYARAVKGMAKARKEPTGPRYHEWRKRSKYHWYHTRLLKHAFPQALKPRAETVHHLTNLLGDHHDIHVFVETLGTEPDAFGEPETIALLTAMGERLADDLERRALALGARLFAEETDALTARWGAWWSAWEGEERLGRAA